MRQTLDTWLQKLGYFHEALQVRYVIMMAAALILLGCVACNTTDTKQPAATVTATPAATAAPATTQLPAATPAPAVLPANVTKDTKNPLPDLTQAATAGAPLYAQNCAFCHGATGASDGDFNPKPPRIDSAHIAKDPDGELFLVIKNGKGKMPAMKRMTDEQIWQVLAHVRTLAKK